MDLFTKKYSLMHIVIILSTVCFMCLATLLYKKQQTISYCKNTHINWIHNQTYEKVYSLVDTIEQCVAENKKVTLNLTGHGGGVNIAVLFFDLIKTRGLSNDFIIVASGEVSSSANIILLSSNTRCSLPGTLFYWHQASSEAEKEEKEVLLDFAFQQTGNIVEKILGRKIATQWEDSMSGHTPSQALNAKQALSKGLINHIIPYK